MLYLHVYLRKGFRLQRSDGQFIIVASTRRYVKEVFIDRLTESIAQQATQLGVFEDITLGDIAVVYYDAAPTRGAAIPGLRVELAIPDTMVSTALGTAEDVVTTLFASLVAEALVPEDVQLPPASEFSGKVYATS